MLLEIEKEFGKGIDRSISKMEENQALQIIRRVLIPLTTEYWNEHRHLKKGWVKYDVTSDALNKHLVKTDASSHVPTDLTTTDVRKYVAKLPNIEKPFIFDIYKDVVSGKLMTFRTLPDGEFTNFDISKRLREPETSEPLTEHFSLDRREEGEGLQFILRYLIPEFVKQWNDRAAYKITEKQLSSALRKVDERRSSQYLNVHPNDSVYYAATIPVESYKFSGGLKIKFTLTKGVEESLIVGFESPLISSSWYYVRPPHRRITESVSDRSLSEEEQMYLPISKKEEDWAVHKIKETWGPTYGPHFNRTLRKIRHEKGKDHGDVIDYWFKREDGLEFLFMIRKNCEGLHISKWTKRLPDGWIKTSQWINIMEPDQLNEVEDEDYSLSKEEEQSAVIYLLRNLMPQIIKDKYLHYLDAHPTIYKANKYPKITALDVSRKLKKIRVDYESAYYESVINDNVDFAFMIRKQMTTQGPQVIIGAQGPANMNMQWTWYSIDYDEPEQIKEEKKPSITRTYPISKMEEEEALQFIKRVLVPESVDAWNKMISPKPLYTAQEVSRNLRKVRREVPNKSTILAIIAYESKVRSTEFTFKIAKIGPALGSKIYVGYGNEPRAWIDLWGERRSLEEAIDFNDSNRYAVSKMEEAFAVEYIKDKMIPYLVTSVNDTKLNYTGGKPADVATVRRTLKKVEHVKGHPRLRDNVTYQVTIPDEPQPFRFNIYKNSEKKLMVNNVADGTSHFVKM